MHVLIIPSWYPVAPNDLAGSFFREQAQALAKQGCQVGVVYPQLRSLRHWSTLCTGKYGLTEERDVGVVTLRRHGMSWFPRLPSLRARQWRMCAEKTYADYAQKHGKPDLIHAHALLHAGSAARCISQRFGVPYVVTEHSSAFERGLVASRQRQEAAVAAHWASRLFAVSREFCSVLDQVLPDTAGRWEWMPNIVQERFLNASLDTRRGRQFTFLHVSMLDPNKAVGNLIDAYAAAFGQDSTTRLVIGGDGRERAELERRAKSHGLGERISFLGALSREAVLARMEECDAFVLPSRTETFGVVLVEALALGKPVIATRCGGPESIVGEDDGILVPVDDLQRLTDAMKEMRNQYDRYDPVKLRSSCEERFSERAVTQRLIEMYRQVLTKERWRTASL